MFRVRRRHCRAALGLFSGLADLVFPPRCALCEAFLTPGAPGRLGWAAGLCPECAAGLEESARESGAVALEGLGVVFAASYQGAVKDAVHAFKYGGRVRLGRLLGGFMAQRLGQGPGFPEADLVAPVPLHPRRLAQRGFNQALVLAQALWPRERARINPGLLRRVRYTRPQVSLGRGERAANVAGAFALGRLGAVAGRRVVLVDDVLTTGATLSECARVVLKAGAASVTGLCLGRALAGSQLENRRLND